MKKVTFLFLLLLLFSCEKEKPQPALEFEIYTNQDISACGVNNPLMNLKWLNEIYKNNLTHNSWTLQITLYQSKTTGDDFFFLTTKFVGKIAPHTNVPLDETPKFISCDNTMIYLDIQSPEFSSSYEYKGIVYEKKLKE